MDEDRRNQPEPNNIKIVPAPEFYAEEIKKMRAAVGMTQELFAAFLNVSKRTVEAWEAGRSHPSGAAARILQMMEIDKKLTEKFPFVKTELSDGLRENYSDSKRCTLSEMVQKKLDKHDFEQMLPIIKRLEKGSAAPSELGKLIGKSPSTVRRYMETLAKTGYVKKVGSTNRLVYKAVDMKEKMIVPVIRKNP